jgi:hypothetical protein
LSASDKPVRVKFQSRHRGWWAAKLDDRTWISFGYHFSPNTGSAFCTNRTSEPVRVSGYIDRLIDDGTRDGRNEREWFVPEVKVGSAYTTAEADKIGRKGVRKHVRPVLAAAIAKAIRAEGSSTQ